MIFIFFFIIGALMFTYIQYRSFPQDFTCEVKSDKTEHYFTGRYDEWSNQIIIDNEDEKSISVFECKDIGKKRCSEKKTGNILIIDRNTFEMYFAEPNPYPYAECTFNKNFKI